MDLSIVIVNTNHADLLEQCLDSLVRAPLPAETEIIVVDNASDDGSQELVTEKFPQVRLVRQDKRRGPAANYNAGYVIARGKYVLGLNEDAEVVDNTVLTLYEYLENHPEVGCAAPRLVYPDGSPQSCCFRFPTWTTALKKLLLQKFVSGDWVSGTYPQERAGIGFRPDWIMATSLMYRREALEKQGFYDEQFVIYYEEVDMAMQLRRQALEVAWVPEAVVKHHHGVSNFKISGERDIHFRKLLYQSRYRYFRKNHGRLYTSLLQCLEACLFFVSYVYTQFRYWLGSETNGWKPALYSSLLRYCFVQETQLEIPQP